MKKKLALVLTAALAAASLTACGGAGTPETKYPAVPVPQIQRRPVHRQKEHPGKRLHPGTVRRWWLPGGAIR